MIFLQTYILSPSRIHHEYSYWIHEHTLAMTTYAPSLYEFISCPRYWVLNSTKASFFQLLYFCVSLILSLVPCYIRWMVRLVCYSLLFEDEIGANPNCKDCIDWKVWIGKWKHDQHVEVVRGFVFCRWNGWWWQEESQDCWWTCYLLHACCAANKK